jgi:CheY-like chemotaxis protein
MADDAETLRARIRELETLCGEVYVAAVELGFPQNLLNRLWTVVARGQKPQRFTLDLPPRATAAPAPAAQAAAAPEGGPTLAPPVASRDDSTPTAGPAREPMQIPDIKLTDRPLASRDEERAKVALPDFKPLPTRRTVMVVDDDPMMLEVLVRILARENYELVTATGGPDALQKAAAHEGAIDLLITDYAMPDMKGRELAEKMRDRYSDIRVLYQTGFSDMLFEDRLELEDGSAFVEKPFTARGLREAARFILFGAINPP